MNGNKARQGEEDTPGDICGITAAAAALAILRAVDTHSDPAILVHALTNVSNNSLNELSLVRQSSGRASSDGDSGVIEENLVIERLGQLCSASMTSSSEELRSAAACTLLKLCGATASSVKVVRLASSLLRAPQQTLDPVTLSASHLVLELLVDIAINRRRQAQHIEYDAGVGLPQLENPQKKEAVIAGVFDPTLSNIERADRFVISNAGRTVKSKLGSHSVAMVRPVSGGMEDGVVGGTTPAGGILAGGLTPATVLNASWEFSVDDSDASSATCLGLACCPLTDESYSSSKDLFLIRSYNGYIYTRGKEAKPKDAIEGYKMTKGDRVKFVLDFEEADGVCRLYRNDVLVGMPFTGLASLDLPLFPCVQFYSAGCTVSLLSFEAVAQDSTDLADDGPEFDVPMLPGQRAGRRCRVALCSLQEHHAILESGCRLGRDGDLGWASAPKRHSKAVVAGRLSSTSLGMYPKDAQGLPFNESISGNAAEMIDDAMTPADCLAACLSRTETLFSRASTAVWWIGGQYEKLMAGVAIADLPIPDNVPAQSSAGRLTQGASSVHFEVWADERRVWSSGPVDLTRCKPMHVAVPLIRVQVLRLVTFCEKGNACAPAVWVDPTLTLLTEWFCGGWRNDRLAMTCALCGASRANTSTVPSPADLGLAPLCDSEGQPLPVAEHGVPACGAENDATVSVRAAEWTGTAHGLAHALLTYLLLCIKEERRLLRAVALASALAPAHAAPYLGEQASSTWFAPLFTGVDPSSEGGPEGGAYDENEGSAVVALLLAVQVIESERMQRTGPCASLDYVLRHVRAQLPRGSVSPTENEQRIAVSSGWPLEVGAGAGVVELEIPWPLDVEVEAGSDKEGGGATGVGPPLDMDAFVLALQLRAGQVGCDTSVWGAWPGRMHLLMTVPSRVGPRAFLATVVVYAASHGSAQLQGMAQALSVLTRQGQSERTSKLSIHSVPLTPILRLALVTSAFVPSAEQRRERLAVGVDGALGGGVCTLTWYQLAEETGESEGGESRKLRKLHKALSASVRDFLPSGA